MCFAARMVVWSPQQPDLSSYFSLRAQRDQAGRRFLVYVLYLRFPYFEVGNCNKLPNRDISCGPELVDSAGKSQLEAAGAWCASGLIDAFSLKSTSLRRCRRPLRGSLKKRILTEVLKLTFPFNHHPAGVLEGHGSLVDPAVGCPTVGTGSVLPHFLRTGHRARRRVPAREQDRLQVVRTKGVLL